MGPTEKQSKRVLIFVGKFYLSIIVFSISYAGNDYVDNEENSCKSPGRPSDIDIPHGQGAILECKGGGCINIKKVKK